MSKVDVRTEDNRRDALLLEGTQRQMGIEEFQSQIFEPANVDDVVHMPNEVDVVGLDANSEFDEERRVGARGAHGLRRLAPFLLGVFERAAQVPFHFAVLDGLAFVVGMFPFAEAELHFHAAFLEVDA